MQIRGDNFRTREYHSENTRAWNWVGYGTQIWSSSETTCTYFSYLQGKFWGSEIGGPYVGYRNLSLDIRMYDRLAPVVFVNVYMASSLKIYTCVKSILFARAMLNDGICLATVQNRIILTKHSPWLFFAARSISNICLTNDSLLSWASKGF